MEMETSMRAPNRLALGNEGSQEIYHGDPMLTELGEKLARINGIQELDFLSGQIMEKIKKRKMELIQQEKPRAEA